MTIPSPWYKRILIDASSFECMVRGIVYASTYVARHEHRTAIVYFRDVRPWRGHAGEPGLADFDEKIRIVLLLATQDLLYARDPAAKDSVAQSVCISERFHRKGTPLVLKRHGLYGVHSEHLPVVLSRETTREVDPLPTDGFSYVATVTHRTNERVHSVIQHTRGWESDACWLDVVSSLANAVQNEVGWPPDRKWGVCRSCVLRMQIVCVVHYALPRIPLRGAGGDCAAQVWWPMQRCREDAQVCRARRHEISRIGGLPEDITGILVQMDDPWYTFHRSLAARGHAKATISL